MPFTPLEDHLVYFVNSKAAEIENTLNADLLTIYSPITGDVDRRIKNAIEKNVEKRKKVAVIVDTFGGVAEVVERIVTVLRHNYEEVDFIVPDKAMSAGTMLVMSGDRILMNYFSLLGPIDPQIFKDGKFVPALSYLNQFEQLVQKSKTGELSTAEYALINKLDLAELDTYKQAKELSIDLLKKWLSQYKFKDWNSTETQGKSVTDKMRQDRAGEIAEILSDNDKWHSHGRGINMNTLITELNLKIEDYGATKELYTQIHEYYDVFVDYLVQKGITSFVHSRYHY